MAFLLKKAVGVVVCTSVLLAGVHGPLTAQQRQGYSLSALTDAAALHLPAILQKRALVQAAQAGITDARHAALPTLKLHDQLTLSTANSVTGTFLPLGVVIPTAGAIRPENTMTPATGNIAMVYGEYELVNFGLRKARVEDAVVQQQFSAADLSRDLYLLKLQVSKLYFTILRNTYQLGIDKENIHRQQLITQVIQAVTKSGIRPGVDSLLAGAALSKARISYNQRSGAIRQLEQQLSLITGIRDSIAIDTSWEKTFPPTDTPWAKITDSLHHPLLDYYRRQQATYTAAGQLIRKSYLPKLLLAGGAWGRGSSIDYADNYQALSAGLGYQRFNYAIGVAFVYNLFDAVHRHDKLAINQQQRYAGNYALAQQQLTLSTAEAQAQTAMNIARDNLQQLPAQLQAAANAYNQKLAQYKAGIINLVDLADASFVLYQSQTDYAETINNWWQARLDMAAATGDLDIFIQSLKSQQ